MEQQPTVMGQIWPAPQGHPGHENLSLGAKPSQPNLPCAGHAHGLPGQVALLSLTSIWQIGLAKLHAATSRSSATSSP